MAVSVKDVAAAASVSVGTVSNVLNQPSKVAASTVERVMSAIAELGYVRNDAARQLRAGRSRCIGLVVLDVGNPFFAEVARGAEARAAEEGMTVLLGSSDERLDRESAYLDLFQEQRVNGVLVTPATDDLAPLARLRDARRAGRARRPRDARRRIPRRSPSTTSRAGSSPSRTCSNSAGAASPSSAVRSRIRQVADRLEGARRAVAAVDGASLEVIETPALTVLQGRAAGEALVARDAADRPDAVFAANDLLAVGLLQGLSLMADLRVPDDIALIGYDDIDFASATVVPLSSIRQPASLIGYTAVDVLLADWATAPDTSATCGSSPSWWSGPRPAAERGLAPETAPSPPSNGQDGKATTARDAEILTCLHSGGVGGPGGEGGGAGPQDAARGAPCAAESARHPRVSRWKGMRGGPRTLVAELLGRRTTTLSGSVSSIVRRNRRSRGGAGGRTPAATSRRCRTPRVPPAAPTRIATRGPNSAGDPADDRRADRRAAHEDRHVQRQHASAQGRVGRRLHVAVRRRQHRHDREAR